MNDKQLEALKRFVALCDRDPVAQADLSQYGNAYEHLTDYLADHTAEQLTLSPRDLHPAK